MAATLLYDLSEFLATLLRGGIQRVVFQVARHWPVAGQLAPVRIADDGRIHALPARVFDLMAVYFGATPGNPETAREELWRLSHLGRPLKAGELSRYAGLLCTEVFFHGLRTRFYQRLLATWGSDKVFFLVYDLLPWLRPEYFTPTDFHCTYDYLPLLRNARHLAFISRQTHDDFARRFLRTDTDVGPAVCLGADGLGTAPPRFDPSSRRFAVLGTIEPRKNHFAVLDAFERLWAAGVDVELTFLGRLGWISDAEKRRLTAAQQQPRFTVRGTLDDAAIVRAIRGCRATVYPSLAEGFGLPPLESLALGVPVIVSAGLPSVGMIDPGGQVRLDAVGPEAIRRAVLAVLDDAVARRLHREIESLPLPTWQGMAARLAAWVQAAGADDRLAVG